MPEATSTDGRLGKKLLDQGRTTSCLRWQPNLTPCWPPANIPAIRHRPLRVHPGCTEDSESAGHEKQRRAVTAAAAATAAAATAASAATDTDAATAASAAVASRSARVVAAAA